MPVWQSVEAIRQMGLFSTVTAAFWKEQPSFAHVLAGIPDDDVIVVPLFSAEGYFTQRVLPAELRPRPGQNVRITTAVGAHPHLAQIVDERLATALDQHHLAPENVTVVVVGHGTRRAQTSADTTEAQAERLRRSARFGNTAVLTAYLDQPPLIKHVYQHVQTETLIIVPFFIAAGLHTQDDIPEALGIAPEPFVRQQSAGHTVIYAPPVGLTADLPAMILSLADVDIAAGVIAQAEVWAGVPAVRPEVLGTKCPQIGELFLGEAAYLCHTADAQADPDTLTVLENPTAVRQMTRGEAGTYRPWATLAGLPRGWQIPTPTPAVRSAALVTIYPHLAAPPPVQSVAQVAARQVGKYRAVGDLTSDEITAVVERVCATCALEPAWHSTRASATACPEPCVWWLEKARDEL
ncbi:MAG: hypothetical protein KDD89_03515 [Anaerolineales bacterium]|nr:hypothetical protein [Anaerolineales bacterium]